MRVATPLLVGLFLTGCAQSDYRWGWHVLDPRNERGLDNLKFLADGFGATLGISVLAILLSCLAGLLIAIAGMSGSRPLRMLSRAYVEVFRSIPLIVLILWVYYGLPILFGVQFSVFAAGLLSLALSDSAFEAEIFRGGIQSIDRGQVEAAHALGLGRWATMRHVVLPQALRRIVPALGNQFVYVLKMSSIVSIIGYQDLTRRANELTTSAYRPLEIYTVLILEYLLLILVASAMVRAVERRMARSD